MKAAVWYEKGVLRIEDYAEPSPEADQIKIKVKVCGICGSDLHEYSSGPFIIPARPHPLTGREGGPVVLGHEFSGVVEVVGQQVKRFKAGDRVTVNTLILCGECHYCRRGQYNMCLKLGTIGFAWDGALAEHMIAPEYAVHPLPDSITDEMGTFVEPLAVAVRAVKRSRLGLGQTVTVVGAGPIGLLVMQVCRAAGASQVFVVEPMTARGELARRLGASQVIDPAEADPGKVLAGLTGGLRSDVAIDCVGSQASFDTAVRVSGRRAIICVAGMALKPISVPFLRLWGHEKEITFCTGYENEFPAAISLLADGRVKVIDLISDRIQLDDLLAKGFRPLIEEPDEHVKILVYPN